MQEREQMRSTSDADHLCVLIHGLWGNPGHMWYIESALRDKYSAGELHILVPKGNAGNFTYDGIELGAERVTHEIERFLDERTREGNPVRKLSIVGYSLGGLVARYVIGLLYSKGCFSKMEPINFTTFATPHLGVRKPGWVVRSRAFNIFGSRTLSTSGRQLFVIDTFRDTKRPILAILAEPSSIFIQALVRFKNRVLYANIINDRSAPYHTTSISSNDPYTELDNLNLNYLHGYAPNILDPSSPFSSKEPAKPRPLYNRLATNSQAIINGIPYAAALSFFIPVGIVILLVNSGVQSVRSAQRIRLHESGKAGIVLGSYRIPLMIQDASSAVEGAIESMNPAGPQEYLTKDTNLSEKSDPDSTAVVTAQSPSTHAHKPQFPPLPLTDDQFAMIANLNKVGFRKYLVHIHKVRHSHAAIIARSKSDGYVEGRVVVGHWLEKEFEI